MKTTPYKITIEGRDCGNLNLTDDEVRFMYSVLSHGTLNLKTDEHKNKSITMGMDDTVVNANKKKEYFITYTTSEDDEVRTGKAFGHFKDGDFHGHIYNTSGSQIKNLLEAGDTVRVNFDVSGDGTSGKNYIVEWLVVEDEPLKIGKTQTCKSCGDHKNKRTTHTIQYQQNDMPGILRYGVAIGSFKENKFYGNIYDHNVGRYRLNLPEPGDTFQIVFDTAQEGTTDKTYTVEWRQNDIVSAVIK